MIPDDANTTHTHTTHTHTHKHTHTRQEINGLEAGRETRHVTCVCDTGWKTGCLGTEIHIELSLVETENGKQEMEWKWYKSGREKERWTRGGGRGGRLCCADHYVTANNVVTVPWLATGAATGTTSQRRSSFGPPQWIRLFLLKLKTRNVKWRSLLTTDVQFSINTDAHKRDYCTSNLSQFVQIYTSATNCTLNGMLTYIYIYIYVNQ